MSSEWSNSSKKGEVKKGPWTFEEDIRLLRYIKLHGEGRWSNLAKASGLQRCGKSCRLRWVNYLHPGLKRGRITPEEERVIMELHARWGNRWSLIAQNIPGRTDNEIKNYWRSHIRKRIDTSSDDYTNPVLISSTECNRKPDSLAALSTSATQRPTPHEVVNPITQLLSSCPYSSKRNITKHGSNNLRARSPALSASSSSSESCRFIHRSSGISTCSGGSKMDKVEQTAIKSLPATNRVHDQKTFKNQVDFNSTDIKVEPDQTLYKCPSPEQDALRVVLYQLYSGIDEAACNSANEVLTTMLAYSCDHDSEMTDACPDSDELWNTAPSPVVT